ncbi:hypothetical protein PR202_gb15575 [Eleusine coracana subsp. coracana]|uniref:Secreted protein n=1 Tax=Eleusine coracana subsp. coracana TaxID=191504 RepID=A0AAV5EY01_ELECO|nr:hypothetical protein PR202_gb15575 [Eleusine coracana subsp. coracana]
MRKARGVRGRPGRTTASSVTSRARSFSFLSLSAFRTGEAGAACVWRLVITQNRGTRFVTWSPPEPLSPSLLLLYSTLLCSALINNERAHQLAIACAAELS